MNAPDVTAGDPFGGDLAALLQRIDNRLDETTPGEPAPASLRAAMRYSLLAPGKRVRAMLTVLSGQACGSSADDALDTACAIEMVHAASLILDDLPMMDDAALRRGRASCHREHGEATATLAAISLMNRAFGVVAADRHLDATQAVSIVGLLSRAIGTDGLTGGQEGDLHGIGTTGVAAVEWVHARKTGALFAAATEAGAIIAGFGAERRQAMRQFGLRLGLAFQFYDDLLDVRAAPETVGKPVRADDGKVTLATVLGYDAALARADAEWLAAIGQLDDSGGDKRLRRYVDGLVRQLRAQFATG